MNTEIQKILELNHIQGDILARALHQDIRELFLARICAYMKESPEQYLEIRKSYYRTDDDLQTVRNIVRRVGGGELPEEDLAWLNQCVKAHFHKKPRRRRIPDAERTALWQAQGGLCAVCRRPIALSGLHVDHIVPWDYVGDELADNLQALCPACNREKSNRVSRALHHLFLTREGAFS
nr:HNH endonuclease signature motif containing protein [uncultured Oscillibacter sp.]